jgi:hypothetical protein
VRLQIFVKRFCIQSASLCGLLARRTGASDSPMLLVRASVSLLWAISPWGPNTSNPSNVTGVYIDGHCDVLGRTRERRGVERAYRRIAERGKQPTTLPDAAGPAGEYRDDGEEVADGTRAGAAGEPLAAFVGLGSRPR